MLSLFWRAISASRTRIRPSLSNVLPNLLFFLGLLAKVASDNPQFTAAMCQALCSKYVPGSISLLPGSNATDTFQGVFALKYPNGEMCECGVNNLEEFSFRTDGKGDIVETNSTYRIPINK